VDQGSREDADLLATKMASFVGFVRDQFPRTDNRAPDAVPRWSGYSMRVQQLCGPRSRSDTVGDMDWPDVLPGIIGSFVGVLGWLVVGIYIQRRQFVRQARNAAKAVYFEIDVNLAAVSVAREHGLFSDLDRSSFERLLPELATLLSALDLRTVVDAYMTHAGYRQLASRADLPAEVRLGALGAFVGAHQQALDTLRACAFTKAEMRGMQDRKSVGATGSTASHSATQVKP
jgi:hypothetical protein